jgi:hypothetical protein
MESRTTPADPRPDPLEALREDDPELDATDFAHPAWWRGHEHAAAVFCQKANAILDGKDDGKGVANDPWETTRRRLLALRQTTLELVDADTELARAVNFCEPTSRLDHLMQAEDRSRVARNAARQALAKINATMGEAG